MLQLKKEIENRAPTIEDVEELAKLYIKIIESHWLKTPGSPSPDIITAEMLRICEDCVELIESIIPNLQTQSDSYGEDTHLYEVVKCWISYVSSYHHLLVVIWVLRQMVFLRIAEVRRTIWRHLRQNGDKVNDCYQKAWEIAKLENFEAHPGVGALHDATEQLLLWIGEFARAGK